MGRVYAAHEIPHFTIQDAQELVQSNASLGVVPGVTLGNLWENRQIANMTALEEAFYDHWTCGRFACVGDSVHKVTTNFGAGGMAAIESAAALANALNSMNEQHKPEGKPIEPPEIQDALSNYEHSRKKRMRAIYEISNYVTRVQAIRGPWESFLVKYVFPSLGDGPIDDACDLFIGSHHINYIPLPARSLSGTMPFNFTKGLTKNESLSYRALRALPLLLIALLAFKCVIPLESASTLSAGTDSETALSFSPDFAIFYTIMLFETYRSTNAWSPLRL